MSVSRSDADRTLVIGDDGWASSAAAAIERIVSPNQDDRPAGCSPTLIVVHNISLPPGVFGGRAIDALFTNTLDHDADPYYEGLVGLEVSSHFLIRRDGALVQFVACDARAWHAGASTFEGRERCNDFSIGIELEGDDFRDFEDAQYDRLASVIDALRRRYPIVAIAGHSDIAPGRKTDPGPHFDWSRVLARSGGWLRKAVPTAP
jgi:AmpD protein